MEEKRRWPDDVLRRGLRYFLVSIMSFSLWRDKQINAFMATNRAWGIQCDRVSQAAWVVGTGAG